MDDSEYFWIESSDGRQIVVHTDKVAEAMILGYRNPKPCLQPSDLSRIASVLSELAAVVRIQNGNLHTDINEMLARADSVLSLLPKQ